MFSVCSVEKAGWEKKVSVYGLIWMASLSGCVRSDFLEKGQLSAKKIPWNGSLMNRAFSEPLDFRSRFAVIPDAGSLTHTQMRSEGIMQSRSHTLSAFYAGGSQPLLRLLYISRRMPGKRKERDPDPDHPIGFRIFSKNDLIFNLSFFDRFHGLWPQVCKKTGECQSSDGSGMEAMPPGRSVLFPETEMAVSRQAAASSSRRESRERERRRSWLKKVPKKMSPAPVVSTG